MVKEKESRIYDEDGFRKRAAAICVKNHCENEVSCCFTHFFNLCFSWTKKSISSKVLLVSSSRTPDKWIVPGGGLEPDESSLEAAEREVMEEAGIRGTLSRSLGQFEVRIGQSVTILYIYFNILYTELGT